MRRLTAAALAEYGRLKFASLVKSLHPASSPFLSGDTFRSFCHVHIDDSTSFDDIPSKIRKLLRYQSDATLRLFIDLHILQDLNSEDFIIGELSVLSMEVRRKTLLLFHNHDKLPSFGFFARLASLGYRLYSVNIVNRSDYVHPLPIGLENRWRLNNGRTRPFRKSQAREQSSRAQLVFAAFTVGTNTHERAAARAACIVAGVPFNESRLTPRQHRKHLLNSYFVISPPGNGPDCHRTWEAIYLGCVPVILRGTLAEEFVSQLPILEVEDWTEFLNIPKDEALQLYQRLRERPCELAYESAWKHYLSVS